MESLIDIMLADGRKERAVKEAVETLGRLEKQSPSAAVAHAFEKGFESLKEALAMFETLGQQKFNDWLLEDVNFPAAMHDIERRIKVAKTMFDYVQKHDKTSPDPEIDKVVNNLGFNCATLDGYVHSCNTVLFNVMASGKWMEPEAQRYRTLYINLTETVSDFYNVVKIPISDWINYIRKTKNVKGEQLFAGAVKPSATDNPECKWLTDYQWNHGIAPEDLRKWLS